MVADASVVVCLVASSFGLCRFCGLGSVENSPGMTGWLGKDVLGAAMSYGSCFTLWFS